MDKSLDFNPIFILPLSLLLLSPLSPSLKQRCFHHFILRVLSRRSSVPNVRNLISCFSNIYGFDCSNLSDDDISASTFSDNSFIYKVFHFAYSWHPVEKLRIDGVPLDLSAWCCYLSTCRSMNLSGFLENKAPIPPLTLNFLKSLTIQNYSRKFIRLEDDMFPSCPLLERVVLLGPCFARAKITAPNLQYLKMAGSWDYGYSGQFPEIELLFTPKLARVKFDYVVPSIISTPNNFLSLHKVGFSLLRSRLISQEEEEKKEYFAQKLRGVLDLLQYATSLLNAVEVFSQYLPLEDEAFTFRNLKHLTLKGHYNRSITMPNHMLNFSLHGPSLQTFAIQEDL